MLDQETIEKLKKIEYALVPGTLYTDEPKLKPEYYFHWEDFEEEGIYNYYAVGVRGAGKTYNGVKWLIKVKKGLLIRRTDPELEIMTDPQHNPFNPLINENEIESGYVKRKGKKLYKMYAGTEGDEEYIGDGVALNTFATTRSADYSYFENVFWDEFIKQPDQQNFKDEGSAWNNALETITRNRHHVTVVAVANSNDIYNPVFKELGVVNQLEKLLDKAKIETQCLTLNKRHIKIILYKPTEEFISFRKCLGLWDLTEGTNYAAMAYDNQFIANDFSDCEYHSIIGYKPVLNIDDYAIWRKKGTNELYVTYAQFEGKGNNTYYSHYPIDCENLVERYYNMIRNRYLKHLITFESYDIKRRLLELFKLM